MTITELTTEIKVLAAELGETVTGLSKMRKMDLVHMLRQLQEAKTRKARIGKPVNETLDGGEIMRDWLALPADKRTATVEQTRDDLASAPSPRRDYQTSQEALAVLDEQDETDPVDAVIAESREFIDRLGLDVAELAQVEPAVFPGDHRDGCECEDCDEFYADDVNDTPIELEPEERGAYLRPAEAEFAAEVDALIARDLAADVPENLVEYLVAATDEAVRLQFEQVVSHDDVEWANTIMSAKDVSREAAYEILETERDRVAYETTISETDIAASQFATLVQFGTKLVWGKLIATVNRRTRYSAPILATVEMNGVRRLVAADDILIDA